MSALARSEWLHRHPEMPHRDLDHFRFVTITRIVPLLRVVMCVMLLLRRYCNPFLKVALIGAATNGKVCCPPTNASAVAVYDPLQKRISFIQGAGRSSQRNKWAGIAMAPDGHLFCAPARARSVLVIDPDHDALDFIYNDDLFDMCGAVKYWTQDEVSGD